MANGNEEAAKQQIDNLQTHYQTFIKELVKTRKTLRKHRHRTEHFEFLNIILKISFSEALNKDILAQGELLSTKLFSVYLEEIGMTQHCFLLWNLCHRCYDEPQIGTIKVQLRQLLKQHKAKKLFITQGYICRNARGEVDNLKRGGSDYSASLIAAA